MRVSDMINVDLTIVGFLDEINHVRLAVSGHQPTVKSALEAMRACDVRRGVFCYEERLGSSRKCLHPILSKAGNDVVSMNYRGHTLCSGRTPLTTNEERVWRFSVLRRAGDRSVLMQNTKNVPFDQFRLEDGDQIFWSLVTVLRSAMSINIENSSRDDDALVSV